MKKNLKNIDDLFKDELGSYAETPPPAVWDSLEKRLNGIQPASPRLPYRWPLYVLICASVVFLGVSAAKKNAISNYITNVQPNGTTDSKAIAELNNTPANEGSRNNAQTTIKSADATIATDNGNAVPEHEPGTTGSNIAGSKNNNDNAPANITGAAQHTTVEAAATTAKNNQSTAKTTTHTKTILTNKNRSIAQSNNPKHAASAARNRALANNTVAHKTPVARRSAHHKNSTPNNTSIAVAASSVPATNEHVYSSNTANPATEEDALAGNGPKPYTRNEDPKIPEAVKAKPEQIHLTEDPIAKAIKAAATPAAKISRLEAGVKAGYEGGFNNSAGKKVVVSPYIQYNISNHFSVMLQPAVKSSHVNSTNLSGKQSFYKVNNDSSLTTSNYYIILAGTSDTVGYTQAYTYKQSHDSIIKSYTSGGTYMEFELPVLVKYKIGKGISVYGGPTVTYSKYVGITEHTYTQTVEKSFTDITAPIEPHAFPVLPSLSSVITYQGTPLSNYSGPLYTVPSTGSLRMGYMLGFTYEYGNRWLLDGLVQQGSVKSNVQGGYNVNTALSAPYFRFTLGYKIIK